MKIRTLFSAFFVLCVLAIAQQAIAQRGGKSPPINSEEKLKHDLREEIEQTQEDLKSLLKTYGKEHAKVKAMEDSLKSSEKRLDDLLPIFQIYYLRYIQAQDASLLIREVFDNSSLRIATDPRTNALIVRGPREKQEELQEILARIDREVDEKIKPVVQVFRLPSDAVANQAIEKLNRQKLIKSWSMQSSGRGTQLSLTADSTGKMQEAAKLLKKSEEEAQPKARKIRVVWLVSDLPNPKAIPRDMEPVVLELQKYGITGMSLASQALVQSLGQFELSCLAELNPENQASNLVVQGELQQDTIQISLEAIRNDEEQVRLSTSIKAPLGHPVVLGVSPIGDKHSAFVVTVYEGN